MSQVLQLVALLLVAVTLSFALAHAAELPGKLRLDKETYSAVQPIYYPGFTLGALSEPAAIVALIILLAVRRPAGASFGWTVAALIFLLLVHGVYWLVVHPVNRFWLKDQNLKGMSAGFFAVGHRLDAARPGAGAVTDWTALRDRWEYGHVVRAGLALLGFICLAIAATS
jgi:hypothetical protein